MDVEQPFKVPMSQQMFEVIAPLVPKRSFGLDIVGIDVTYGTYAVGGIFLGGYAFLLTVKGALIGKEHYITNTHVIAPAVPTEAEAKEMIQVSLTKLREAKAQQVASPN